MRLGHDREVVAVGGVRHPARHRPTHEHPVPLEPQVVMQPPRMVLLNHEPPRFVRAAMFWPAGA